ncbi:MAG TPA: DUF6186 family protein [Acidimicrobiales bacterium]|jgi:hypothetical protein|nr:DUF6186 family protein [Acidimicrobiales bacterium]
MAVTVFWLGLIAASAVWEVRCHRSGSRWSSLSHIVARGWTSAPIRVVLVAAWAFVGWHVFARYTLPG